MSDKYEKAAKEYKEKAFASSITPPFASREFGLADALRWYEKTYLAEALTAAAMMREKETCEWVLHKFTSGGWWEASCGYRIPYNFDNRVIEEECPHCTRRIVEKVQPPEGGAR